MDNVISTMEKASSDLEALSEVYKKLDQMKTDVENARNRIAESMEKNDAATASMVKGQKTYHENDNKSKELFFSNMVENISKLDKNTTNSLQDLDKSVSTRIRQGTAGIEVLIHQEGEQIQRGLENVLTEEMLAFQHSMTQQANKQTQLLYVLCATFIAILVFSLVVR